jgi:hypothetical protein
MLQGTTKTARDPALAVLQQFGDLIWGAGTRPMFWAATLAVAAVAVVGARFRSLVLTCAVLCFLIWLGSEFLPVAMSV